MSSYRGRLHRNIQLWDSCGPEHQEIAGFWQHGTISIATFFDWMDRLFTFGRGQDAQKGQSIDRAELGVYPIDSSFDIVADQPCLHDRPRDCAVPLGNYVVLTRASHTPVPYSEINDIVQPLRPFSPHSASEYHVGHRADFSDESDEDRSDDRSVDTSDGRSKHVSQDFASLVKQRDNSMCLSCGRESLIGAAHILPRAFITIWQDAGFQDRVSASEGCGSSRIDSIQNGLTLCASCWFRWDAYLFAVNVDDSYKFIEFEKQGIAGFECDRLQMNGQPHERPLDDLLRWHYAQAIHANVGGTSRQAQGYVEIDYWAQDDTWCDKAGGQEMFEAELGNRLNQFTSVPAPLDRFQSS